MKLNNCDLLKLKIKISKATRKTLKLEIWNLRHLTKIIP